MGETSSNDKNIPKLGWDIFKHDSELRFSSDPGENNNSANSQANGSTDDYEKKSKNSIIEFL